MCCDVVLNLVSVSVVVLCIRVLLLWQAVVYRKTINHGLALRLSI